MEEISEPCKETSEVTGWAKSVQNGKMIYDIITTLSSRWSMNEIYKFYDYVATKLKHNGVERTEFKDNSVSIPYEKLKLIKKYGSVGKMLFANPLDVNSLTKATGILKNDIVILNITPQTFRPAFGVWVDKKFGKVVLLIRGTKTLHDLVTDLMITPKEVEGGYVHGGIHSSAEWFDKNVKSVLQDKINETGYDLVIVGHSLGAGVGSVLTMKWLETFPNIHCFAVACPCILSLDLARKCGDYVTALINDSDFGVRVSGHSVDDMREEISKFELAKDSWFGDESPLSYFKSYWGQEKKENVHIHHYYKDRLYPAGKIYHFKVVEHKIHFGLADQIDFECIDITPSLLEDHRWYSYEKALDLIISHSNSYFI